MIFASIVIYLRKCLDDLVACVSEGLNSLKGLNQI